MGVRCPRRSSTPTPTTSRAPPTARPAAAPTPSACSTNVTLTAVNNATNGNNGLPVVTSAITIEGNGNTISRQSGSPNFRILAVGSGGNLTLNSATISGGIASGTFPANIGGGVYFGLYASANSVTSAPFPATPPDSGGGISDQSVHSDGVEQHPLRQRGRPLRRWHLCRTSARRVVTNSTLSGNTAGFYGGGIVALRGTVTVTNSTLSGNSAVTAAASGNQHDDGAEQHSLRQLGSTGGGMALRPLTVQNSTLSGNSANCKAAASQQSWHSDGAEQHPLRQLGRLRRRHQQQLSAQ